MSMLSDLVQELENTMDKLNARIKDEKEKLIAIQERQKSILTAKTSVDQTLSNYKKELEKQIQYCFNIMDESRGVPQMQLTILSKSKDDVSKVNEKFRKERMKLVEEYREKNNAFEQIYNKNKLLQKFIETCLEQHSNKNQLTGIPNIIRNIADSLQKMYGGTINKVLEEIISERSLNIETVNGLDCKIESTQNPTGKLDGE